MPETASIIHNPTVEVRTFESIFYSPSSIVAIFNAATVTKEEKKIIPIKGIFKKTGTTNYSGNFFNTLKDEAGENSITLLTPSILHNKLDDNKTIEFNGFITRRLDKQGRIEIRINLVEVIAEKVNKFSEEETKKILLLNKKIETGIRDLDTHIKSCIFNNRKIVVKVVMGKSGIIDSDIKKALESAIALYDIEYHRVSLSAPEEIISKIRQLDAIKPDVICVARGGGENLEIFENLDICQCLLECKSIMASAIGHADNITLFEKLADKKFITPTQFGSYLKEIYNQTIEELQNSKAKLIQDVTQQLSANYNKQLEHLNEQLKLSKELHEKTKADLAKTYMEKLNTSNLQLKHLEELASKTSQEKASLHQKEVDALKSQMQALITQQSSQDSLIKQTKELASNYQKQLSDYQRQLKEEQSKTTVSPVALIVALIIGLILGIVMAKG